MKRVISWYSDDPQTLEDVAGVLAAQGIEMKVIDVSDDDDDDWDDNDADFGYDRYAQGGN